MSDTFTLIVKTDCKIPDKKCNYTAVYDGKNTGV